MWCIACNILKNNCGGKTAVWRRHWLQDVLIEEMLFRLDEPIQVSGRRRDACKSTKESWESFPGEINLGNSSTTTPQGQNPRGSCAFGQSHSGRSTQCVQDRRWPASQEREGTPALCCVHRVGGGNDCVTERWERREVRRDMDGRAGVREGKERL